METFRVEKYSLPVSEKKPAMAAGQTILRKIVGMREAYGNNVTPS
jgi:hypothetical protein